MDITKTPNEILICILQYFNPLDVLIFRLVSKRFRVIVALRYRREIMLRAAENEAIISKIKLDGLWEKIELHPSRQAKILLEIQKSIFTVMETFAGNFSVQTAPNVVLKLVTCFLILVKGSVSSYFTGNGIFNLEKIQTDFTELDPKTSIGNLKDSVYTQVKKLSQLTLIEEDQLKSLGEGSQKLYQICQDVIKWNDTEYEMHELKNKYKYYRREINIERVTSISKIFIRILKRNIPSSLF